MRDNSVDAFFALVRAGLWGKAGSNLNVDLNINENVDWEKVYQLAQEQSVQGLVLQGIGRLKSHNNLPGAEGDTVCDQRGANLNDNANEGLTNSPQVSISIPQALLLQWIGEVQLIEQRNKDMNAFVANLFDTLRSQGVNALLAKGQGVAQCYEKPLWRTSGDVDLLLSNDDYPKAKESLMPLGVLTEPEETAKKHLAINIEGWIVELHGTLHCGLSRYVDKILDEVHLDAFEGKMSDGRGRNVRVWKNGETDVPLLAAENSVFYVFTHILQHFYKGGIGLRQICDWCRLLWTFKESLDQGELESRICKAKLTAEWMAFGTFAVEYLGMPIEAMPLLNADLNALPALQALSTAEKKSNMAKNLGKKADKICDFILEVGNFGHNRDDSYFQKHSYFVQKCISAWRRVWDLGRHARIFPINSIRFFFGIMYNGIVSAIKGE